MPKETAYENKANDLPQGSSAPIVKEDELREWLSFAKTQALTTELLQFELDALADALEYKAKSIIEAFEELVSLMHQNPQFAENEDVSKSMSNMVRSLQFQDIAKQKLENISNALKSVHDYAKGKITETNETHSINATDILSNADNMSRVITERTLAEMRKSMMKNLELLSKTDFERISSSTTESHTEEENGANVELF